MKHSKYITALAILASTMLLWNCADDDKLPIDFKDLEVSGGAYAEEVSPPDGSGAFNKLDASTFSYTKIYNLVSPAGGDDITQLDYYISFTGVNKEVSEVLYTSLSTSDFTQGEEYPQATVLLDGGQVLSTLGLVVEDLEGGDTFDFRIAVTNPNGTFSVDQVSANFDNQSSDFNFTSLVVCELPEVPAGDWIVEMEDSYGDGWQTVDNGGPGITITLNTGQVFEVGLCSPYEPSDYDCTNELSSGTAVVTIPDGILTADWYFPGDTYSEITFRIFAPSGNLVGSGGGTTEGAIPLNLCNEL
ncbi:hypothetical protein GCM10022393_12020 [Aquimarina addita]|uniref:DUF1735 domain-containing protein n=1 Tax=Aquimarina addita TaxID=870485 RepID=A0ABP7XED8_9FLAO